MLEEMTSEASLIRVEEDVRRFWRRSAAPETVHAARLGAPVFVLLQQPLDAVGQSWNDQLRLLMTADLYARYHTMRGNAVYTHTGWGCHGLAVERLVEDWARPSPQDMVEFCEYCRDMATHQMERPESQLERLGLWFFPPPAFMSMEPQAIGQVWSALRRLWDAGRLRRERRVVPVCPRCATPLSELEAAGRPIEVESPAIWLRLPWDGEPSADFLVPVPRPWMLPGMVALAAHPKASYALVESPGPEGQPPARLILAEATLAKAPIGDYRLLRRLKARDLRGASYRPPFTFLPAGEGTHRVILDATVPVETGTGLLAVTPAFDARSLALATVHGQLVHQPLDDWGGLDQSITPWRGLSPLDAEPLIVDNLRERGLVHHEQVETHTRSLCPYCDTQLLPQARSVWSIDTASGPWIVGRDNLWGAPLPVWSCGQCGHELCLAGLDDLAHRTGLDATEIDPHRPALDRLALPCPECAGAMQRVTPVVDPAFELAALSWLTAPQPGPGDRAADGARQHLAIGLGDRDLGWLGDLTEIAAQLQGALAWEQAVPVPAGDLPSPGLAGREPTWDFPPSRSADALHWTVHARTTPDEAEEAFIRPLWQWLVSSAVEQEQEAPPIVAILERWLLARLHQAAAAVSRALESGEPHRAASELEALLREAGDWQARCHPGGSPFRDQETADEALGVLSRLLAPFVPHLAEAIHRRQAGRTALTVHAAAWPVPPAAWRDRELLARVEQVKLLAGLAASARAAAGLAPEAPLPQARIVSLGKDRQVEQFAPLQELLAIVLGASRIHLGPDPALQVEWRPGLDPARTVAREVPPAEIESALVGLPPEQEAALVADLRQGLSIRLDVAGRSITLLPDEVRLAAQAPPDWAAATGHGYLLLLRIG